MIHFNYLKRYALVLLFGISYLNASENIQQNSENSIHFSLGNYSLERKEINNQEYLRIKVDNLYSSSTVGQAELPEHSFKWAIGKGSNPNINITNIISDTIELSQKIYPKQPARSKSSFDSNFYFDNKYYNSSRQRTDHVLLEKPFIIRGVQGIKISIKPFQYDPLKNRLIIIKECDVKISNVRSEKVNIQSPAFYKLIKEMFTNSSDILYSEAPANRKENYLIIAENSFHSTLTDFISYRENKYNVNLISADALGGNTILIINKIKELYADPATRPTYLLLVGAFPLLPMCHATSNSSLGSPQNDLWFGAVDGDDYYADIFVGRFSVGTGETNKLTNCINKTISFEQNSNNAPDKNLYIAAGGPFGDKATGPMNFIDDTYFKPAGYEGVKLYEDITPDITTERAMNLVNNGLSFLFYSGHGNWDHWKTTHFFNDDVYRLTNSAYPIVFSFACLTGDLNTLYGECFGEAWMNAEHGASAFIGATTETTWDPDDLFQRTIISAMFEKGYTTMQSAVAYGKVELDKQFPKWGHFYAETFNLCGDPALEITPMLPVAIDNPQKPTLNKAINLSIRTMNNTLILTPTIDIFQSISIDIFTISGRKVLNVNSKSSTLKIPDYSQKIRNGFYYGVVSLRDKSGNAQKMVIKLTQL